MSLDSYNSQYPLAYYEVGTAYSFYGHNHRINTLEEAGKEIVSKYSAALSSAVSSNEKIVGGDGQWAAFTRAVGVVVDKQESSGMGSVDKITVMFKREDGNYVLNKFAVGTNDVFTNDKENIAPAATIDAAKSALQRKKSNTITGPTVETVTGPTIDVQQGKKTGPTIDRVTGPTVEN